MTKSAGAGKSFYLTLNAPDVSELLKRNTALSLFDFFNRLGRFEESLVAPTGVARAS